MTKQIEKLKLKYGSDLQLFLFVVRPQNLKIEGEKVSAVLAYDLTNAIIHARKEVPDNYNVFYYGQALSVNGLLNIIELPITKQTELKPADVKSMKLVMPKMTKGQFVNSLKLCCDDFVKTKKDKVDLKKIIAKIK